LSLDQQQRLLQLPPAPGLGETSLRSQRWVVVDLETSGLNLNRDQVLSIGAMVIEDGAIDWAKRLSAPCCAPTTR
jgi:DNA polymerase III subunit epsilon